MVTRNLQGVAQGIIDSYQMRVKTVGNLMLEAAEALKNLQLEQQELIYELRELLAKSQSLRKKDFDTKMKTILSQRREGEEEVVGAIEEFHRWGERMLTELRRFFSNDKPLTREDFADLKEIILFRQEERERETARVLREFHREQEELRTALLKLLSKGDLVRIKDCESAVKALQFQQREREGELGAMLKELDRVSDEARGEWQGVMTTMGQGLTAYPVITKKRNLEGKEG